MNKLPNSQTFECVFKIIKNGPEKSWYESGFLDQRFLGIYASHHSDDTNIFMVNKRLVADGEADAADCGWAYAADVKVLGWTKGTPPEIYRKGLIEA